jgi:hypothetical protein
MLAHNLKDILSIVPELKEHIKQANVEEEFPLDNRDGCLASYVRCYYLVKVAGKPVEPEIMERLEKAATLYGIKQDAVKFISAMKKYAEEKEKKAILELNKVGAEQAQRAFEHSLSGFIDIEKTAETAQELVKQYGTAITSPEVKRYAGQAYFLKEAAIQALEGRTAATGKEVFRKIAEIVQRSMAQDPTPAEVIDLCAKVTVLDKKAGLHMKGFNIYKEVLTSDLEKVASVLSVSVCGKNVPYEKIEKLGSHRISQFIGKDVAESMTGDPLHNKHVFEALPLDSQRALDNLLRYV